MTPRRWLALAAILVGTAALYLAAGLAGAYLAADDFQWLGGGHTFTWGRLQYVTGGDRFYRPAADLWFAAATSACGFALPCHHLLLLAVHLANIALVFVLGTWLFGDLRTASLATLLFAFEPAYTQAVVWLSAITGVLCAFGYLGSLTAIVSSWRAGVERQRRRREGLAVALFALASFSHEAARHAPAHRPRHVAALRTIRLGQPAHPHLRHGCSRRGASPPPRCWRTDATCCSRNPGIARACTPSTMHSTTSRSLYVGPSSSFAHVFIVAALVALVIINRTTRFGVLWMLIAMLPYLPFTAGNTSRYAYLPAIGFACAIAGALVAGADRLRRLPRLSAWAPTIAYSLAVIFIAVRFGPFAYASARGQVRSFEQWRIKARQIADTSGGARRNDSRRRPWRSAHRPHLRRADRPWERRDYQTPVRQ